MYLKVPSLNIIWDNGYHYRGISSLLSVPSDQFQLQHQCFLPHPFHSIIYPIIQWYTLFSNVSLNDTHKKRRGYRNVWDCMIFAYVNTNFKDDSWQQTAQDYSRNEQGKSQNHQSEQLLICPKIWTGTSHIQDILFNAGLYTIKQMILLL
jgi:hypothetical protein